MRERERERERERWSQWTLVNPIGQSRPGWVGLRKGSPLL